MATADAIILELEADENATLADPIIRQLARDALALAMKTGAGSSSPSPSLPGSLYGKLIAQNERVQRLRFVAERGERPSGAVAGYFTRDEVLRDASAVMRAAAK